MKMAELKEQKDACRKQAFVRRKAVHDPERGEMAGRNLIEYLTPMLGKTISAYMPIRTEVNVLPAMRVLSQTSTIAVPVILGPDQRLEFHRWTPTMDMASGPFGAQVPADPVTVIPRVVVLPLLAFDKVGNRLGYGGGYYDRTLQHLRQEGDVLAVGLAYSAQEVDELPCEATDQRLDAVVTEEGARVF